MRMGDRVWHPRLGEGRVAYSKTLRVDFDGSVLTHGDAELANCIVSPEERACRKCGELTANAELCRDCDIEQHMSAWPHCKHCGVKLYSEWVRGAGVLEGHADGCPDASRDALARDHRVAEYEHLNEMRSTLLQRLGDARRYAAELAEYAAKLEDELHGGKL